MCLKVLLPVASSLIVIVTILSIWGCSDWCTDGQPVVGKCCYIRLSAACYRLLLLIYFTGVSARPPVSFGEDAVREVRLAPGSAKKWWNQAPSASDYPSAPIFISTASPSHLLFESKI